MKQTMIIVVPQVQDNHGKTYLYLLGGWNKEYTSEVHRIEIDVDTGAIVGTEWEAFTSMSQARSDQACMEVQVNRSR